MPKNSKILRLAIMATVVLGSVAFILHGLYRFDHVEFLCGVGGFLGFDRMYAEGE